MGMRTIVVLGYIIRGPLGGLVFHHLQYLLGLKRLGHRVLFLEDSEDYAACYDPTLCQLTEDASYGLQFLQRVFSCYDLQGDWAYFDAHRNQWYGKSGGEVVAYCKSADLLLNLSGSNPIRPWTADVPVKVYVDTDPVFTQLRNLQKPDHRQRTALHTHHYSFGENIGTQDCLIPDDGFSWKATRQPVVPEIWPQTPAKTGAPFSTVMQWDSYQAIQFQGKSFDMKSASFEPYFGLPAQVDQTLCLAIGSPTAPTARLQACGWQVQDAQQVTGSAESYTGFILRSAAEWSVAKQAYVTTCSGWFSERSCAYLACGRPVVVQDTGFSRWTPIESAILPFSNPEEAAEGIRKVQLDAARLQNNCRMLVTELFDYRSVLPPLLP